jgi:hypothetical protein
MIETLLESAVGIASICRRQTIPQVFRCRPELPFGSLNVQFQLGRRRSTFSGFT